jgi:acyl-CoA reductase-like NAD-dependent aldehyde dehydrogenase/nicotinamidase-related amidase
MSPLLLLVDLQEDFLAQAGLEPHRDTIVAGAAQLLAEARSHGCSVLHVHTRVHSAPDDRMRHWKATGRWSCVAGTPGEAPPGPLSPRRGEAVALKTGFSAAQDPAMARALDGAGHDIAIVAGVHTHACVRQAVLDCYEAGLEVWVARDAVGSFEPAHAAQTEAYLRQRRIPFLSNAEIVARLEGEFANPVRPEAVDATVRAARAPAASPDARAAVLNAAAALVEERAAALADEIVASVGKPVRYARGEVARTAALFRAVARRLLEHPLEQPQAEGLVRRRPLGRVAIITPWNNPLAIAAGQVAPAYAYGNAVVWKPPPAGVRPARSLQRALIDAGAQADALQLLEGDGDVGLALAAHPGIDAVCFTGATSTGRVIASVCSGRSLPLQAELGGNNAAIVTGSVDLASAARALAEAAFGSAGQRCTATRRVIVLEEAYAAFCDQLVGATGSLVWGDPREEATQVGPMLSAAHAGRTAEIVERARGRGYRVLQPHCAGGERAALDGAYHAPTLVWCDDPSAEIVQEETFGPVLVVQKAAHWDEAVSLLNDVRHGLAAAVYSHDAGQQAAFLQSAQAGILKINQPTVEAGVDMPFGGWKCSGVGTPQHGACNREFFTRAQAVYGARAGD